MPKYELRPYQKECVDTINSLPDGSRVIVALATGLGKTVVASRINRKGRLLILSHRDELVRQPEKYFDCSYGIEKAEEHSNGEDVVSASVQTICQDNRLNQFDENDFDVIVVDEAHHAAAPSYQKVINHFHPRLLIGLTATPKRGDGARLSDTFDKIVFARDLLWGIRNGYLCNIRCMSVTTKVDISKVKITMGDYSFSELSNAIDQQVMFETIAKTYMDNLYGKGHHTVIYTLSVKGCQGIYIALQHRLTKKEMKKVAILTGSSSKEERDSILSSFLKGTITIIINCMVLTEGTDLPNIDAIITARPTANESLYTQIVGRGTRLCEGKEECLLYDILPKTNRKLCAATSLLGMEYNALKQDKKKKLEEGEFDLLKFADELANEEAERKKQFEENAKLAMDEFDFLTGLYKTKVDPLKGNKEHTIGYIARSVLNEIQQQKDKAREEDGEYNFRGMSFRLGNTDAERYLFRGRTNDYTFYVSRPDMLGKVTIRAIAAKREFRTEEPIPMQEAIDTIYRIFKRDCEDNFFVWREAVQRKWDSSYASERQMDYLLALMDDAKIERLNNDRPTMFEASILIDHLKTAKQIKDQAIRMRREAEQIARSSNNQGIASGTSVAQSKQHYESFASLIKEQPRRQYWCPPAKTR